MTAQRYVVMAAGPDRIGLREYIDSWLRGRGAAPGTNIRVFSDSSGSVFLRAEFTALSTVEELRSDFERVKKQWSLWSWMIQSLHRQRVLVLAGRDDHCLYELLALNNRDDGLSGDIVAVASNHENLRGLTESHGVAFTHIPWPSRGHDPAGAAAAHDSLVQLIKDSEADLVVLARFMQIVSGDVCDMRPVINIHHGDVAAFPGANPYGQALDRGVKAFGATAHYATAELDQGPIIAQAFHHFESLGPSPSTSALRFAGRLLETEVLVTAVQRHCRGEVLRHRGGTVHMTP